MNFQDEQMQIDEKCYNSLKNANFMCKIAQCPLLVTLYLTEVLKSLAWARKLLLDKQWYVEIKAHSDSAHAKNISQDMLHVDEIWWPGMFFFHAGNFD